MGLDVDVSDSPSLDGGVVASEEEGDCGGGEEEDGEEGCRAGPSGDFAGGGLRGLGRGVVGCFVGGWVRWAGVLRCCCIVSFDASIGGFGSLR